jgi:hypothetical protein
MTSILLVPINNSNTEFQLKAFRVFNGLLKSRLNGQGFILYKVLIKDMTKIFDPRWNINNGNLVKTFIFKVNSVLETQLS